MFINVDFSNIDFNNVEFMCSIIGVIGTLLGTVLGWLLQFISSNLGINSVTIDSFENKRSSDEEYAYILKSFIYNTSGKAQSVRDVRIVFVGRWGKHLYESKPCEGYCDFYMVREQSKDKRNISMILIDGFSQRECFFSDLIEKDDFKKILNAKKVYFVYKNKENHTKKKRIIAQFDMEKVSKCTGERFP